MQRRSFLKFVGLAVGGLAITPKVELLNLLEEKIEVTSVEEFNGITFKMMHEAYIRACERNNEPNLMLLSETRFKQFVELIAPQNRWIDENTPRGYNSFRFMNAQVMYGDVSKPYNEIITVDDNFLEGYKFRQDEPTKIIIGIKNPPANNFYKDFV